MKYGKKVSFVHPKAEILSAEGSDIIEKLKLFPNFTIATGKVLLERKCLLFPTENMEKLKASSLFHWALKLLNGNTRLHDLTIISGTPECRTMTESSFTWHLTMLVCPQ